MRRLFSDLNPTARGFALILLFCAVIVVLQLQSTLIAVSALLQIAFLIAIACFVYFVWREQRHAISMWPARASAAFYAAAALLLLDLAVYWIVRPTGLDAVAFLLVLAIGVFVMVRVWRDQHTYR